MTPDVAVEALNKLSAVLRDMAGTLRSSDAVGSEEAILLALKISAGGIAMIEEWEPTAASLIKNLQPRAERVRELQGKIASLRKLSDDVNTTPAEAGTAHRTANKLEADVRALAEILIAADDATEAFAGARGEFVAAYALFSDRYESAEAAARFRATRTAPPQAPAKQLTPRPPAPHAQPAQQQRAPETEPNWVAIVAVAIPVGFLFAPALIAVAYFGPKIFRKPKQPTHKPTPPAPPKRPATPQSDRPGTPAVSQEDNNRRRDRAMVGWFAVAFVMIPVGLALKSAARPTRTVASVPPQRTPVQAGASPPAEAPQYAEPSRAQYGDAKSNLATARLLLDDIARRTGKRLKLAQPGQELLGRMGRDIARQNYNWSQLEVPVQDQELVRWISVYGVDKKVEAHIKSAAAANAKGSMAYLASVAGR